MPAFVARAASVFLIFLCTSAVAQEKKAHKSLSSVPCQKRLYKGPTAIFDEWMDATRPEHLPQAEADKDQGVWEGTPYTTLDGGTVSVEHAKFTSADIARKNFDAVVSSATQVLERGPAIGRESSGAGERVLLQLSQDAHKFFTIMRQNKQYLYFLSSSSLREVEDFEEKFAFDCK
jgi:hypothetical protein